MALRVLSTRVAGLLTVATCATGCAAPFQGPATYVTDRSATLNGSVASNRTEVGSWWFEYGLDQRFGFRSDTRSVNFVANAPQRVAEPLRPGFSPGTTILYRLCAQDQQPGVGPNCSGAQSFTLGPAGGTTGIAFMRGFPSGDVFLMGADGANQTNSSNTPASSEIWPSWSPDGRRIAIGRSTPSSPPQIWTMDAGGGNLQQLTNTSTSESDPSWSPDGRRIAFVTARTGSFEIFSMRASDGGDLVNLTNRAGADRDPAWSPDGSLIAFSSERDGNREIYVMNADGSGQHRLTTHAADDEQPDWSPDARTIAFSTTRDGDPEIATMPAEGGPVTQLTFNTTADQWPSYGHFGGIAFASDRYRPPNMPTLITSQIYRMSDDGQGQTRLTTDNGWDNFPDWSPRP